MQRTAICPSGFKLFLFPSNQVQREISTLLLRLPREIRSIIYGHVLDGLFKSYAGAFVNSDFVSREGDMYMFDGGAWYSIRHFRGDRIDANCILELDASPWAYKNLSHLLMRTPARHIRTLGRQIFSECIDDLCVKAGKVCLAMEYRNHRPHHKYDEELFHTVAQNARDLTVSISYRSLRGGKSQMPITSFGWNPAPSDELVAVNDIYRMLKFGCKTQTLSINFNFDVPFGQDCRLTVNDNWVRDKVEILARFGCRIDLCIYNKYDGRYESLGCGYPMWEHIFCSRSSYEPGVGWSTWKKQEMNAYEAAALEC